MLGIILVIILGLGIFLWLIVYGGNKNKTNDEILNEDKEEMKFCKKVNSERKQKNEKK